VAVTQSIAEAARQAWHFDIRWSAALRHWPAAQVTVRWHASSSTVQNAFRQALASS